MKKFIFLMLIITTIYSKSECQKVFFGGGIIGTIESYLPEKYNTRIGIEGIFGIKPINNLPLVAEISPNLILNDDNYNVLFSLPVEVKWYFGNELKFYPSIGYLLRNQHFSGYSAGIGFEYVLKKGLKIGIDFSTIRGKYRPTNTRSDLINHAEASAQLGVYFLKEINLKKSTCKYY